MSGPAQPVARPLRAALEQLRRDLPPLAGVDDIPRYRAAGAARRAPIADTAARLGLEAADAVVAGMPATVLRAAGEPRGRVLFLHGGGLIAGDRTDGVDVVARHAAALGLEAVSLEYPLAPEHPLEAMVDAVEAALAALGDAVPLVLAGYSGGGGLAAAAALERAGARERVAGLLLLCPMLGGPERASRAQFADAAAWSADSDAAAWRAVLERSALVAPGAQDVVALPPTFVDVGAAELFRDEGIAFASRLLEAGCRAELHVWSGAFHASESLAEDARASIEAHRVRGSWLARLLDDEL